MFASGLASTISVVPSSYLMRISILPSQFTTFMPSLEDTFTRAVWCSRGKGGAGLPGARLPRDPCGGAHPCGITLQQSGAQCPWRAARRVWRSSPALALIGANKSEARLLEGWWPPLPLNGSLGFRAVRQSWHAPTRDQAYEPRPHAREWHQSKLGVFPARSAAATGRYGR